MSEWFWFFHSFCNLSENFPASSTKFFGKVVKTSFYVIIGTFRTEIFCWRRFIFSSLPVLNKLKSAFWQKVFDKAVKTQTTCAEDTWSVLKKNDETFRNYPFLLSISGKERNIFGLRGKICLQDCENCIVRDLGNILGRKFFFQNV